MISKAGADVVRAISSNIDILVLELPSCLLFSEMSSDLFYNRRIEANKRFSQPTRNKYDSTVLCQVRENCVKVSKLGI